MPRKPPSDTKNAQRKSARRAGKESPLTLHNNGQVTADDPEADAGEANDDDHETYADEDGQTSFVPPTGDGEMTDVPAEDSGPFVELPLLIPSAMLVAKTRLALQLFVAALRKAAKTDRDLLQIREAASSERIAREIEEQLLPQLTDQTMINFDHTEGLLDACRDVVGRSARSEFMASLARNLTMRDGETMDDAKARVYEGASELESLIGNFADVAAAAVQDVVVAAADRGYQAGVDARDATPEAIAKEAAQAVRQIRMSIE